MSKEVNRHYLKNRFPNDKESHEIIKAREEDLKERGNDHPVYNYNGKIVELRAAELWYDDDCKYIKPKTSMTLDSCIC